MTVTFILGGMQVRYFTLLGPIAGFILFILIGFIFILVIGMLIEKMSNERQNIVAAISSMIFLPVFLLAYAFLDICMPMANTEEAGGYSTKQNAVMTDRFSGEFLSRIPLRTSDNFLVLPEAQSSNILKTTWFFNPIRHKPMPGLPLDGAVNPELAVLDKISYKFTNPQKYIAAWKKFRCESGFVQGLSEAAQRLVQKRLREAADDPMEKSQEAIISSLKISLDGDLTDQQKAEINAALVNTASEQVRSIVSERKKARQKELIVAGIEDLRQEFAPYCDLTFEISPLEAQPGK